MVYYNKGSNTFIETTFQSKDFIQKTHMLGYEPFLETAVSFL